MAKVRRVDFSPAEWLAGTSRLTLEQQGLYWNICSLIYDSGGPIRNDAGWIGRCATDCAPRRARRLIDQLIGAGKLVVTEEGLLTNRRAEVELDRADDRIKSAKYAGNIAGISHKYRANFRKKPNEINETPNRPIPNHQPPTNNYSLTSNSTDPARGAAPAESAAPRTTPGPTSHETWRERLARYDPHKIRETWPATWGPRPDAPGHQPAIPADLLAEWRLHQRKSA